MNIAKNIIIIALIMKTIVIKITIINIFYYIVVLHVKLVANFCLSAYLNFLFTWL